MSKFTLTPEPKPTEPTMMQRILLLLSTSKEPLQPKQISLKLGVSGSSVRSLLTLARSCGLVEYYEGIRGAYNITSAGRKHLKALSSKEEGKALLDDKRKRPEASQ